MANVTITASGAVGSGKSALLGEIEILLQVLAVPYEWDDPLGARQEKHLTHADWVGEIERTKPHVVLVERPDRTVPLAGGDASAMLERARAAEMEVVRLRALLDQRPAFNSGIVESYAKWTADVHESDGAARKAGASENAR